MLLRSAFLILAITSFNNILTHGNSCNCTKKHVHKENHKSDNKKFNRTDFYLLGLALAPIAILAAVSLRKRK